MVAAAHEILHCTRLLAPCRRFGAASELLRLRQVLIDGTIVMAAATGGSGGAHAINRAGAPFVLSTFGHACR